MAQTIKTYLNNGLFAATAFDFEEITEVGTVAQLEADISECKDAITVIVDIPEGVGGNYTFACIGTNGKKTEIMLTTEKMNVFRITSHGLKKDNGYADFEISTDNSAGIGGRGIKVAFLKYSAVINN